MTEEHKDPNNMGYVSDQCVHEEEHEENWNYEGCDEMAEDYEGYYYDEESGQWILEEKSGNDEGYVATPHQQGLGSNILSNAANQEYHTQQVPVPPNMTRASTSIILPDDDAVNVPMVSLRPAETPEEADRLRQVLDRTYAFEDYEPPSYGWVTDLSTEIFVSLGFKVYFGVLIYCAGITVFFTCLGTLFSSIVFLFNPTSTGNAVAAAESFGFLGIFFFFSLISTAMMCCWMDVLKTFWDTSRTDTTIWGLRNYLCDESLDPDTDCCNCDTVPERSDAPLPRSELIPPWHIYIAIEMLMIPLPLLIAMILTIVEDETILYFVQKFSFVVIIITMCLLVVLYLWFFLRAIKKKIKAYKSRAALVDTNGRTNMRKRWFNSDLLLEELGLDNSTLRWSIVVLFIGVIPNLAIQTYIVITPSQSTNNLVAWSFCICLLVSTLIIMMELSNDRKQYKAVFFTIAILVIFTLASFVSAIITVQPEIIILFTGSLVFSQFGLLKKHDSSLTREERCRLMNVVIVKDEEMAIREKRFSTLLCAGRNTWFACCSCLDIRTLFGYRHPRVCEAEKAQRRKRCALRADFKVLLGHWFTLFILSLLVLIFIDNYSEDTHGRKSTPIDPYGAPVKPNDPYSFCSPPLFPLSDLSVVDFAALCATTRSYESYRTVDRAAWFAGRNIHFSPTVKNKGQYSALWWDEVYSTEGSLRILLLHSNQSKSNILRLLTLFSDAIIFSIASIFAPPLNLWSNDDASLFIKGSGFLTSHLYKSFSHLEKSIKSDDYNNCKSCKYTVIVGDGLQGGVARLLSNMTGFPFITFNAPDVALSLHKFPSTRVSIGQSPILSQNFVTKGNIYSLLQPTVIDEMARTTPIDCNGNCSSVFSTLSNLIERCGDRHGRSIVSF